MLEIGPNLASTLSTIVFCLFVGFAIWRWTK